MAEIQFNVNMDLVDKYTPAEDITIPQENDLSVKFVYTILKQEVPEDLTGATDIVVSFVKPDGHIVLQSNGTLVLPNKVNIVANAQAFTYVGKVYMQVQYKKAGQTFNTRQAFFWVERSNTSCQTVASADFAPYLDNVVATGEMLNGLDLQALIDSKQTAEGAQADVNGIKPRVVVLEVDVASLKTRMTNAEGTISTQGARIIALENIQGSFNTRITNVETKNSQQDTRLSTLDSEQAMQDSRLNAVETRNTTQDTRMNAIESDTSSLATTVANNKATQDTVNTSVNGSISGLSARVTATETKNSQQDNRLDTAESKNTSQDAKIATLEGANSVIISDIDTLEILTGEHESRLDTNDTKNTSQDTAIVNNSSAISSLTTTVNNNQTGMNTRVTALETAKTANDTKNTTQDNRLTALENYDTTQDTRMTTIEGVNTTQNTRLTVIETKNTEQDAQISENTKKVMALRNAEKKLNIKCYDGDNQAIHTSTQYFPGGWNGYKFWMAYTPYTLMDEFVENPSMACSNDGITWIEPIAGLNPMNTPLESERGQKHNSDTSLVYRADLNRLEIWWRRVDRTLGTTFLMRRTSTNGTTWTATETINNSWGVCPVVKYENGKYRLWCYASSVNKIRYGEATEPSFNFGVAREIDTYTTPFEGKNYNMWHFDIRQNEQGLYEMLGSYKATEDPNGETQHVFYSYSTDNITYSTPKIFMKTGRLGNFDSKMTYKPDFVKVGDKLHLYMTGKSVDQTWGTGLSISDTGNLFDVLGAGNDFMLGYPSQKSVTQGMIDTNIAPLGTRMTAVENKNTSQDTAINSKLTKAGDEMTGHLGFQLSSGGKQIKGKNGADDRSGILLEDDGFRGYDWQNGRGVFQYVASTNTFNVQSTNTNLITKSRDDNATLPLSVDATNVDTNYPPRMIRRGNTVTIQGSIRRNAGSVSGVVATLPSTMRPVADLETTVIDAVGTAVPVSVSASNGNIYFNVVDKHVKIILTYVVN